MDSPIAVTISRQFGAGATVIGRQVAQRLGFQYLDREILRLVSQRVHEARALAGREERISSLWDTFLHVFSLGSPESAYPQPDICRCFSDRELFELEG
ncbi:MAG TPA: cytidylate kinase family protein, partial [Desulfuromonadales bacterium]|nr:cytidylate kinase family protein [Desulfuromonadales bacterium]